jgi:hypothetical protein
MLSIARLWIEMGQQLTHTHFSPPISTGMSVGDPR